MRKYREDDFWFEIVTATGPDGQRGVRVRYYRVSCRNCSNAQSYHASGTSNEGLKKIFTRAGWTVGKSRFKHYCPDCTRRHAERNTFIAAPKTPPPAPIIQIIQTASEIEIERLSHALQLDEIEIGRLHTLVHSLTSERNDLLSLLESFHVHPPPPQPPAPTSSEDVSPQPQQIQDQPSIPMGANGQPAPEPAPAPIEDDDADAADWWKELVAARRAADST